MRAFIDSLSSSLDLLCVCVCDCAGRVARGVEDGECMCSCIVYVSV